MSFSEAVKDGFDHYVNFEGRASRSSFWWWVLFAFIAGVVANILDSAIDATIFSIIVGLGLLLPNISKAVRRLHDTGHSGWWILLWFTVIGIIVLLVWYLTKSEPVENKYGPPPAAAPAAA